MGDLRGITSRLDHLAELGVDALWMSPFYRSPQHDAGYDVADYCDVDPRFGTLDDFDALVAAAKARNLRVLVDLVPNHTSSEHVWFKEALAAGPGSQARERYHFRKGLGADGELPPNGWQSVFGGPAWTRVPDGEWYLHLFDASQPDLNWDLPEVRTMFEDVLRFWLDRGVDGFRVDVAHGLIKESGLPDWTEAHVPITSPGAEHRTPPMWDQDGVHDIYRSWRRVLDSYDGDRIMVGEAWVSPAERMARYVRPDEMHQAFNFGYLMAPWTAADQRAAIIESIDGVALVGAVCTWVLSNHDVVRHASRLGFEPGYSTQGGIGVDDPQPDEALGLRRARAATMLMLSLPGSAYLYQGEELGLPEHTTLPDEQRQDPTWFRSKHEVRGRDGCRVPVPWEADAPSFGFGPGSAPWLPQPADWGRFAADAQRGVPGSTLSLYTEALRLRRTHQLGSGVLTWHESPGEDLVDFRNGGIRVITNFGQVPAPLPPGEVLLASGDLAADGSLPPDTTAWIRA
ncbi:glycoside hydrolase family 13 protein [Dactylosporangium aurantiacum]|uniref:Glycoside hydrolase family 13 protein n=1 Tax=Dactylosporangium aurantiacum TaxID=35754 RepID=A0A9Q9IJ60_9ACTN|nr:glycoside hydrolase family 13 protein [Dactylosporangium aurantiacum]MDG6108050.1 glycoside hydrolase family 13 protein [Dactylosporangium aurantiacum]UWZ53685.1 glycoside hydrolase family 13 protein [Dactylosporangium aurantiacum]